MKEVIMTPGRHIEYTTDSESITFGDKDLMVNLKNRERDEKALVDVCANINGELTMGTAAGLRYIAQVEIPARQYNEAEQVNLKYDPEAEPGTEEARKTITVREPVPFDIDRCTIYLWKMED